MDTQFSDYIRRVMDADARNGTDTLTQLLDEVTAAKKARDGDAAPAANDTSASDDAPGL